MAKTYDCEYTIDRSKWVCGGDRFEEKLGRSKLLNEKGRMCCLGQICQQSGIGKTRLDGVESPVSLSNHKRMPRWMVHPMLPVTSSSLADDMISINDDAKLTQWQREQRLKAVTRQHGIKLTFTGRLGI